MEPEWLPDPGFCDFPRTVFRCNTTSFLLDFLVLSVPDLRQEAQEMDFGHYPKKKRHLWTLCVILVSLRSPELGGITHYSGSFLHHSHAECEVYKFTPTKHMVFEVILQPFRESGLLWAPEGPRWPQGTPQGAPRPPQT